MHQLNLLINGRQVVVFSTPNSSFNRLPGPEWHTVRINGVTAESSFQFHYNRFTGRVANLELIDEELIKMIIDKFSSDLHHLSIK